jgi:pseudaminic acid synthase
MECSINGRMIGPGHPTYIVAEMSGNHNQSFDRAVQILEAAKAAGADAVKLQTYTADTITIDSDQEYFQIKGGTLWDGQTLYDLYAQAHTPWEWQPKLKRIAEDLEMDLFSSPFDVTAVDFLEDMGVPAYKVASPELMDLQLLERIASTGKPIIMSTGMATLAEIDEAASCIFSVDEKAQLVLLKCTADYPALPEEINLLTIPHMRETFRVPVGLSDHTLGTEVANASVALGACVVEKHFALSRDELGPDVAFSMEPREFEQLVREIRNVEKACGSIFYGPTERETINKKYRRSLFVAEDIREGERFSYKNVRSVRPGQGLHTRHLKQVLKGTARRDLQKGTPLDWFMVDYHIR